MEAITYSLQRKDESISIKYYEDISIVSDKMKNKIKDFASEYIDDFMSYIKEGNIEQRRTFDEYGIEVLLIGVLFKEYINNARAFKHTIKFPFTYLNNLRDKKKSKKAKIDRYRGILINKILLKEKLGRNYPNYEGLILLCEWLKASNDFEEEVLRIENWIRYLKKKDDRYVENLLYTSMELAEYLNLLGEEYLWYYTRNVYEYLEKRMCNRENREDTIYCTKKEIQYYFNMYGAEIMNNIYKEEFKVCEEKLIFVPGCMKQTKKKCESILTSKGYKCRSCSVACNINKVNKLGLENKYITYIIPHESSIFNLINYEKKKGLIGIACVLNLVSGGFKALRIGYVPQCVILEECGCSAHWLEDDKMTMINMEKLIR